MARKPGPGGSSAGLFFIASKPVPVQKVKIPAKQKHKTDNNCGPEGIYPAPSGPQSDHKTCQDTPPDTENATERFSLFFFFFCLHNQEAIDFRSGQYIHKMSVRLARPQDRDC